MQLVLVHPDATPKQLAAGLAAAMQVFKYEELDPHRAYRALASEEAWIDSGHDDQYALSPNERRALNVLTCAEAAAVGQLGLAGAHLDFAE
jgi:hypothetical protein